MLGMEMRRGQIKHLILGELLDLTHDHSAVLWSHASIDNQGGAVAYDDGDIREPDNRVDVVRNRFRFVFRDTLRILRPDTGCKNTEARCGTEHMEVFYASWHYREDVFGRRGLIVRLSVRRRNQNQPRAGPCFRRYLHRRSQLGAVAVHGNVADRESR